MIVKPFCNKLFSLNALIHTPHRMGCQKNRHLPDVVRVLLLESFVPPRFYVEALSTVIHLINRLPGQHLDFGSPHFCLYGTRPSYNMLHTFGYICFVHLPPMNVIGLLLNLYDVFYGLQYCL